MSSQKIGRSIFGILMVLSFLLGFFWTNAFFVSIIFGIFYIINVLESIESKKKK